MRLSVVNSAQSDLLECYKPNINHSFNQQKDTLTALLQSAAEPIHPI